MSLTDIPTVPPALSIPPLPQGGPDIEPRQGRRFAGARAVLALMLREMSASYGRSPGGYLWAVLEPVAGIALLSAIFSLAFRSPALGSSFPLFYATGIIPLLVFTGLANRVGQAVNYSRNLLVYPSVTFVDAILARFLLNLLTQGLVAFVVFGGILMIFDTKVILRLPSVLAAVGLSAVLALGIGTLNCYLFTRFPVWQNIWNILTRPLFIVSCVFMLFDQIPPWAREWLWYNPIIHSVGMMRHGFYATYHAPYVSVLYVLAVSMVAGLAGLLLLYRDRYDLLER
jgi:capsular polysaccharide transport system permease protein